MRPSTDELDAAVAAGVLTGEQSRRLRVFMDGRRLDGGCAVAARDREDVRFVRGFHDVFMSVGLIALFAGLRYAVMAAGSPKAMAIGMVGVATLAWALAEFFTRRQRLVLPGIVLAATFVFHVVMATIVAESGPLGVLANDPNAAVVIPAVGLAAALAFRLRFGLPFASALVAVGAAALAAGLLFAAAPQTFQATWLVLLLVAGLATVAVAMRFDLRDRERETLDADNAFWLHLAAAPMIVHAILAIAIDNPTRPSDAQAALVVAIVVALALVALVIDRRALLMSGLIYFGIAIATLIPKAPVASAMLPAIVLVLIGGFVVALGAGWRPARRAALRLVPGGLRDALPAAA